MEHLVRNLGDAGARRGDGRVVRMLLLSLLLLLLFADIVARPRFIRLRARRVPPLSLHRAADADATSNGRGAKVDPRGTLRESRLRSRPV